ncbi:MAG: helix-turn-helix domain-containing protein [Pleurocapsa minor HA4230-MV1]|nr:helix-turn-helix domain-containing protein [Pleurocapsa minor HA4230-MV1]
MNPDSSQTNKERLHNLMQQVGIADLNELSQVAKVARLQLIRIQQGLILNLSLGAIARIAKALDVSVDSLLQTFVEQPQVSSEQAVTSSQQDDALIACRQEYQKLQQEMTQLQQTLQVEFQQASLETIESWLLQWPTAATAVRQNPQLPASKLLSLVEPIEQLVKHWNVSTIATVGEELAYDPQNHQLMKGVAQAGELVKVRYVGYKQGDKLLHKAKVSPV